MDWGYGNISSVRHALRRLGLTEGNDLRVIPGVGNFAVAANKVKGILLDRPTLGICLGLQLAFPASGEAPGVPGLGWVKGEVKPLNARRVPHKGWNDGYWFDHSYVCSPEDPEDCLACFDYEGTAYPAVIRHGLFLGCQFHPERSGEKGLEFLGMWSREAC